MKTAAKPLLSDIQTIHMLPRWVTSAIGQGTDSVVFTSGAALAMLDSVLRDPNDTLPGALLQDRMALQATVACLKLENRREVTSDILFSTSRGRALSGPVSVIGAANATGAGRGRFGSGGRDVRGVAQVGTDQPVRIGVERSGWETVTSFSGRSDA